MTSRYSIVRQSGRFLPTLYLTLTFVASSLMPFASQAAWAELQDDAGIWGAALARGNFGYIDSDLKRWLWWMEGQARYRECCNSEFTLNQSLIRLGLGYTLTDQSTVWVGYARAGNYLPATLTSKKTDCGNNVSGQGRRFLAPVPVDHGLNSAGKQTAVI